MATYVGSALRRDFPDMQQHWATETMCLPVFDVPRFADRLIEVPRQRWKKARMSPATWAEQVRVYFDLRREAYDVGFDFQGHSKTALMLRIAKPKVRWSMPATDALARRLNPCVAPGPENQHQVDRLFDVVRQWKPIETIESTILPDYRGRVTAPVKPLLTIQTGGSFADKIISIETLSAVGEKALSAGWEVKFLGGPSDPVPSEGCGENLVGKTGLAESLGWVHHSSVHLCGDTGTGHFAAGCGVPTLVVFTSSRNHPDRYAPYGRSAEVLHAYQDSSLLDPEVLWARVSARF